MKSELLRTFRENKGIPFFHTIHIFKSGEESWFEYPYVAEASGRTHKLIRRNISNHYNMLYFALNYATRGLRGITSLADDRAQAKASTFKILDTPSTGCQEPARAPPERSWTPPAAEDLCSKLIISKRSL